MCEVVMDEGMVGGEEREKPDPNWAKSAFKKSHKGRLHRALGVDENETIPEEKMRAALAGKHGPRVQHMAQAAHNINK